MNILGTLFRLICSWLILVVIAVYATAPEHIAPIPFLEYFDADTFRRLFTSVNWVTVTAVALLVLAVLRIQELIWNVVYAAATILCITFGICAIMDPGIALPAAIENNRAALDFCALPRSYPIPVILIISAFAMGWLCSTAPFRILFTCILSVALWYGCSEAFSYMVNMWAKSPNPSMPELLHAIQTAPWIIAAVPGAFFVVYALLTSFIETFISRKEDARKKREEKKKPVQTVANELTEVQTDTEPAAQEPVLPDVNNTIEEKPVEEPAPKAEEKPVEEPAPKAEEKPEEEAAPKAEEKPEEEAAPKAEEKPAEEPAPKAEEKPAEEPAPKTEEKPVEEPAPKAEEKPAEEAAPKAEEKPGEKAEKQPEGIAKPDEVDKK